TLADVAASSDLTGHASFGGDWELERSAGSIEATVAISAEVQGQWNEMLADYSENNWSGSQTYVDGAISFDLSMSGAGDIDWDYVGATDTLTISLSGSGSSTNLSITNIVGGLTIDTITVSGSPGLITVSGDTTRIDNLNFGSEIRDDTITIDASVGAMRLNGKFRDSTLTITGDLDSVYADEWDGGVNLTVEAMVGTFDMTGDYNNSYNYATPVLFIFGGGSPTTNPHPVVTIDSLTTSDTTPQLTGTVDDNGATITVTVDGNAYGATNNGNGTWTLADNTIAALASGTYDVSVTADNGAVGTDYTTDELTISGAPIVTINTLTTNDTTPQLTGTVSDPGATITVTVDSIAYGATNNGDGTWTLADNTIAALADGTYDVSVSADNGQVGTDATTNELVIDTSSPMVTVDSLNTNDSSPQLTGTVDDTTASISVTVDGNAYAATNNGDGTWTLADNTIAALTDGTYEVVVTATDLAGNAPGADVTTDELFIDTTAPGVPVVNPLTTSDTTPILTGTYDAADSVGLSVAVNGVTYVLGTDTELTTSGNDWTLDLSLITPLAEATYEVTAIATDAVGNPATDASSNELVIVANILPTASDNTVVTLENTDHIFTIADFNFSDLDAGDTLQYVQITSLEAAGSLQLSGGDVALDQIISVADIVAGNLTFTPVPGENGAGYASFDFKVSDGTSLTGNVLSSFTPPNVSGNSDLAFDGTNLWITHNGTNSVRELDASGNELSSFTVLGSTNPVGLTFDGTNLWLVDRDTDLIYELDTSGNILSSFDTTLFGSNSASGLTFDGTNLWLVDRADDLIYEVDTSGNLLSSFATPGGSPRGLTWDGTSLWLTEDVNDLIYELSTTGTVLSSFAAPAAGAAGLTFDGTDFWHADNGTNIVYQLAGPNIVAFSAGAYTMTVDVTANSAPVIGGDDIGAVTEDVGVVGGNISDSGSLTITDPDPGESSFQAATINGTYGDLTIDAGGNWSYSADNSQAAIQALGVGETLVEILTVASFDGTNHDVTVTINGVDDASVIGGIAAGTVAEDGTLVASNTLTITDVDASDNPISFN
ncbi:MAG: hypothetical protein DRI30_06410, partial [Chloroflexi bacterium]